jgi:hypothetical protein
VTTSPTGAADRPWPPGSSTGLGSLPGTDPQEAVRLVFGELAGLPYLPELPDRGLGADMVGRSAALLVDMPVEWRPHSWTLTGRAGRDQRRATDFLQWDLDALEAHGQGRDVVKVQICGPATLGAAIELPTLHKVLTDRGALRDLADSLAEGAARHVADVAARLPGTRVVLQLDEPGVPAVLAGRVPTPSGYGTVGALEPSEVETVLRQVLETVAPGLRVVHCCAADAPLPLFRSAGADAVTVDASLISASQLDALGDAIDSGGSIWLGIVASTDAPVSLNQARQRVRSIWNALGFSGDQLAGAVVPTPACGLAAASPAYVRRAMSVLRDVGRSMLDEDNGPVAADR